MDENTGTEGEEEAIIGLSKLYTADELRENARSCDAAAEAYRGLAEEHARHAGRYRAALALLEQKAAA